MTISVKHLFTSAINSFSRSKVRTILTSLGITIGVLSVVLLIALGIGLKNYLKDQFESLGANLIIIFPGNVFKDEGGGAGGGFGPGFAGGADFDEKDITALQKIAKAQYVVPSFFKSALIEGNSQKVIGNIQGTTEESFKLLNIRPVAGRLLTRADVLRRSRNTVLGYTLAENLFGDIQSSLGKTIKVQDQRFTVVGVAEKKGDREQDNSATISYKTSYGKLNPNKTFFFIYLGVENEQDIPVVIDQANQILAKRYDTDEFSVTEQAEILSTVNQIFSIVNAILVAIGSISLIVGGIGIMNIMFATVTERTKEVGIRRSLGATKKDILLQFLSEAIILSVFGGLLGLILAAIIVALIRNFFPAALDVLSVVIAFSVSTFIGIFFGVFPAKKAANLTPLEAIRYE